MDIPVFRPIGAIDQGGLCTVSGDGIVFRRNGKLIEILTGLRAASRWEGGLWMLTFGGMVDKRSDDSIYATVIRELDEEVPGMKCKIMHHVPPLVTGPAKYRHYWNPDSMSAVNTDNLVQDIAIITLNFVVECISGEPAPTKEVPKVKWVSLVELVETKREYAFDHAKVIPYLLQWVA